MTQDALIDHMNQLVDPRARKQIAAMKKCEKQRSCCVDVANWWH